MIPTVTSFIALVVAASAFGEEREDGSILYLAATPLSRLTLVGAKMLAAWITTLVLLVPALLGFALLGQGVEDVGVGIHLYTWLGVALAAAAYCGGVRAALADDPPRRDRGHPLHRALGGLDRDLRGVGRPALDRRLRPRRSPPRARRA